MGSSILRALGPNGAQLWELALGGAQPTIGPDGTIYVVAGRDLVAIAPTGHELWRAGVPGPVYPGATALIVGEDGMVMARVWHGVVAFDAKGNEKWHFYTENRENDEDGDIALAEDGTLYFVSRFLYALDRAGKPKWNFKSEFTYLKGDYLGSLVIGEDGTVYAVSYYQQLYAITPDGRKKWEMKGSPSKGWGRPKLTGDGRLLTAQGWLQVSSGLAKGGWPARDHDNANTRSQEKP